MSTLTAFDQGGTVDAQQRINAKDAAVTIDNFAALDPQRWMRQFNAAHTGTFNLQWDSLDTPRALIAMNAKL